MKKNIVFGLAGVLLGVVISALIIKANMGNHLLIENPSKYNFEKTVLEIKNNAEQLGWKVPHVTDLQKSMKKFGHDVQAIQIIDLCNPDHAIQILEKNNERVVSPFMPCRVAVYEKSDGKVYVSRMNATKLSGLMEKNISSVLKQAAAEIEQILSGVTN